MQNLTYQNEQITYQKQMPQRNTYNRQKDK